MNRRNVIACIVIEHGRVLMTQRSRSGSFPFLFEFPGGKQEPFESHAETLIREAAEEMGIDVTPLADRSPIEVCLDPPVTSRSYRLLFYRASIDRFSDRPKPLVAEGLAWADAELLNAMKLTPGSEAIRERVIEMLRGEQ